MKEQELLRQVSSTNIIGLDTETTGLNYPQDAAFGVSISTHWDDFYLDFRTDHLLAVELFKIINERHITIVAHNASFDYRMLSSAGYKTLLEMYQCTVVRACLINEHESAIFPWTRAPGNYSLDYLCFKYLGVRKDESFIPAAIEDLGLPKNTARSTVMSRMADVSRPIVEKYAKKDSRLALSLWQWQEDEIKKQGIEKVIAFEQKLLPVIVKAEMRGIHVDVEQTHKAMDKMDIKIKAAQKELNEATGTEFNVNSTPQVRELFSPYQEEDEWFASDGTPIGRTKKGHPSFGGEALHNMTDPRAAQIVNIRSLIKTRDTFLGSHIIGHEYKGVVYPNINQVKGEDGGTGTGRLSYTGPAMQQIPSRNKEVAEIIKPCFLPPPGKLWLETDLASFEVRVFAHLVAAYNNSLVSAYAENPELDFHQWVADMTNLPRNATYSGEANAKQLNLSMIFNQGRGSTAQKMGMPWEWATFTGKDGNEVRYQKAGREANAIIDKYHERVQGVHTLAARAKLFAEKQEQIQTAFGRRLRFPKGYKSYKASGLLIQSTSADINKRNWLVIDEVLGSDGHLILNTHDSYSMAVPEDWKKYHKLVSEAIADTSDINLRVPLILDLDGAGSNWWSAKCGEYK